MTRRYLAVLPAAMTLLIAMTMQPARAAAEGGDPVISAEVNPAVQLPELPPLTPIAELHQLTAPADGVTVLQSMRDFALSRIQLEPAIARGQPVQIRWMISSRREPFAIVRGARPPGAIPALAATMHLVRNRFT